MLGAIDISVLPPSVDTRWGCLACASARTSFSHLRSRPAALPFAVTGFHRRPDAMGPLLKSPAMIPSIPRFASIISLSTCQRLSWSLKAWVVAWWMLTRKTALPAVVTVSSHCTRPRAICRSPCRCKLEPHSRRCVLLAWKAFLWRNVTTAHDCLECHFLDLHLASTTGTGPLSIRTSYSGSSSFSRSSVRLSSPFRNRSSCSMTTGAPCRNVSRIWCSICFALYGPRFHVMTLPSKASRRQPAPHSSSSRMAATLSSQIRVRSALPSTSCPSAPLVSARSALASAAASVCPVTSSHWVQSAASSSPASGV